MMDALPREDVRPRVVSDAIRRRWPSIVLIALLVGAAVGGYLFTRPRTYTSVTTVLLRPLNANALSPLTTSSNQSITVAMQTEASLVGSQPVTDRVNTALHTSLAANSGSIKVEVPANSQIIKIHYLASSPAKARRVAAAYATSFLAYRTQLAETARDAQVRILTAARASTEADLQKAVLAQHGKNPPADVQTQIDLDKASLASILDDIAQANAVSTDAGSVILPATKAFPPGKLKPVAFTAAGVLAGAIVGFLLALWRERRDDRVRSGLESSVFALRVLATIPEVGTDPALREEALRQARVMLLAVAAPNTTVAVAGVSAEDDGTALAGDLARALAAAGYRAALLDASIKDASTDPGLSDLLTGELPDELPFSVVDGVSRLSGGTDPAGARERYSGAALRALLRRLKHEFDFVLVGTQPVTSGDGQAVALAADGLVLTATELVATNEQIRTADDTAARLGVPVLGLVLRKPSAATRKERPAETPPADEPREPSRRRRARETEPPRAKRQLGTQAPAKRRAKGAGKASGKASGKDVEKVTADDDIDAENVTEDELDLSIFDEPDAEDATPADADVAEADTPAVTPDPPVTRRTRRRNARRAGGRDTKQLAGDDAFEDERVSAHRASGGGADSDD